MCCDVFSDHERKYSAATVLRPSFPALVSNVRLPGGVSIENVSDYFKAGHGRGTALWRLSYRNFNLLTKAELYAIISDVDGGVCLSGTLPPEMG